MELIVYFMILMIYFEPTFIYHFMKYKEIIEFGCIVIYKSEGFFKILIWAENFNFKYNFMYFNIITYHNNHLHSQFSSVISASCTIVI